MRFLFNRIIVRIGLWLFNWWPGSWDDIEISKRPLSLLDDVYVSGFKNGHREGRRLRLSGKLEGITMSGLYNENQKEVKNDRE